MADGHSLQQKNILSSKVATESRFYNAMDSVSKNTDDMTSHIWVQLAQIAHIWHIHFRTPFKAVVSNSLYL